MDWRKTIELILGVYFLGYLLVTVYLRARDINLSRSSYGKTYTEGFKWPFIAFEIPVFAVESASQLLAKYMSYKDAKALKKKLSKVA